MSVKPISVSTTVEKPRAEVYAFLDVLANHEQFTDHMLTDWDVSGPATGVGARARMRARAPGPPQYADMEVVEAQAPARIVEEAVGAGGRRRTRGTYTLSDAPDGGTHVLFELRYVETPTAERILGPLVRAWLQRNNQKAMDRLRETLSTA